MYSILASGIHTDSSAGVIEFNNSAVMVYCVSATPGSTATIEINGFQIELVKDGTMYEMFYIACDHIQVISGTVDWFALG